MSKKFMRKIVFILASGNGSNFEAIVRYFYNKGEDNNYKNILKFYLITENEKAYVLKRAEKLNIKSFIIKWDRQNRNYFFDNLEDLIKKYNPELIVLAGFMKIIPEKFVKKHFNKIINIHPSLLPSFKGVNAIKKAYYYGVKYTGVTVHYVNEKVDSGKIIAQEIVKIADNDTCETLEQKIHKIEHKLYPEVIEKLLL